MFTERLEVGVDDTLMNALLEGRKRARLPDPKELPCLVISCGPYFAFAATHFEVLPRNATRERWAHVIPGDDDLLCTCRVGVKGVPDSPEAGSLLFGSGLPGGRMPFSLLGTIIFLRGLTQQLALLPEQKDTVPQN